MDVNSYVSFLSPSALYIGSPGPAVAFFSFGLVGKNRAVVLSTLAGNTTGLFMHSLLGAMGVGLLVGKNKALLALVSVAGATYLLHLSFKKFSTLRSKNSEMARNSAAKDVGFLSGFMLAATNPKPLLFFSIILPTFIIDSYSTSIVLIYSVSFLVISFITLYAYNRLGERFAESLFYGTRRVYLNVGVALVFLLFALVIFFNLARNIIL